MLCEIIPYVEQPLFMSAAELVIDAAQKQIDVITASDLPLEKQQLRVDLIWEKIIHTGDCVQAAIDIVAGLHVDDPKIGMRAVLMGLLHDVGRFEQAARFGKYSDHLTGFNHAMVSYLMVTESAPFFNTLGLDQKEIDTIANAILWHNNYSYDGGELEPQLLRDIDKLALLRRFDHQIRNYDDGPPTEGALVAFREHRLVPNDTIQTKGDVLLRMLSWMYDIYLGPTRQIIFDEGIIRKIRAQM